MILGGFLYPIVLNETFRFDLHSIIFVYVLDRVFSGLFVFICNQITFLQLDSPAPGVGG